MVFEHSDVVIQSKEFIWRTLSKHII